MRALSTDDFLKRIQIPDSNGCMLWTGCITGAGYSGFKNGPAHRFAYEYFVGPIPRGLTIDHLCRNRLCVNPSHLEVVTQKENVLRGNTFAAANKAKTHCPKGHAYSRRTYSGSRKCKACHREKERQRRNAQHLPNSLKTHCNNGHPFSEENTYIEKNGSRHCRTCHREREAQRRLKKMSG